MTNVRKIVGCGTIEVFCKDGEVTIHQDGTLSQMDDLWVSFPVELCESVIEAIVWASENPKSDS